MATSAESRLERFMQICSWFACAKNFTWNVFIHRTELSQEADWFKWSHVIFYFSTVKAIFKCWVASSQFLSGFSLILPPPLVSRCVCVCMCRQSPGPISFWLLLLFRVRTFLKGPAFWPPTGRPRTAPKGSANANKPPVPDPLSLSLSSILSWSKRIPLPPCLSLAVASDKSNCRRRHGRRHSLRPPVAKVKPRSADVLPPTSWNTVPCFDCWVHLPVLATSVNLIAADLHNRPLKDPHNLHMQNHWIWFFFMEFN